MMNVNILSSRRVKVTVNGKGYLVEVLGNLTSSPVTVNVNGQPYVVDVETAEVVAKPSQAPAAALDTMVRETIVLPPTPTPAPAASPSVPHLKAPMPGSIVEIMAKPGERVKYGQSLLTLEAMKMKNAIRSPRDGVVATIEVNEGQTVAHGQMLVTFLVNGK